MPDYRKKMFRGAKIEDCILDFIEMEKELSKTIKTANEKERQLLLGMSKAYRLIVNRLVREFDYSKGGNLVNTKIKDLISSLNRSVLATQEQSKKNISDLISGMYYDEIPDDVKKEMAETPQDLQKGLFEGMSHGYEKVIIDLELLLESTQTDKIANLETMTIKYKKIAEMLKGKFSEDDVNFRSGYIQGEMASYHMVVDEIRSTFNLE